MSTRGLSTKKKLSPSSKLLPSSKLVKLAGRIKATNDKTTILKLVQSIADDHGAVEVHKDIARLIVMLEEEEKNA